MRKIFPVFGLILATSLAFAFPPADEYQQGVAVLNFSPDFDFQNLTIINGCVHFGVVELDNLAKELGIYQIEKVFPFEAKPDNPVFVDLSRWYRIHFPLEVSVEEAVLAFEGKPFIELIEADPVRKYEYTPNDPMVGSQYHIGLIDCYQAWDINRGNYLVEVAIVDSGIDTTHTDLQANWWINFGEDVNGDSVIDLWDWNFVDDDGNGYVDDFWGWDFIQWDNMPHDADPVDPGHGTHCSGIASAVTNNGIGIAGVGFSTRIMILRCGTGGFVQQGYSGINYAGLMYADVISCSWGSTYYSALEQQTINNAHQRGSVICASSGNDAPPAYNHYPSKYNNVIAVGATNENDIVVGFSNYCITPFDGGVDVMAPGYQVLSTWMGGGYMQASGTSMSCPCAAGVCLLIRSVDPTLTPAEVETVLVHGCDDIYPQNPGYQYGLLGYGRVNALNSLMELVPYLTMDSYILDDNGNNDGRADPGETCELTIYIYNDPNAQTGNNITGTLSCDDNAVNILDGSAPYGSILPGFLSVNSSDPFEFSVDPTNPHFTDFTLTLSGGGFSTELPFQIELGRPGILLVDDDDSASYAGLYFVSFDSLDLFVDYWDQDSASITSTELNRYEVVIWETGSTRNTLNSGEQTVLQSFLNGGGDLLISSTNLGADIGSSSFYSNYMHASFVQDVVSGSFQLTGVSGHPFANNTSLFLIGGTGAGNTQSMDAITPLSGASTAYTYNGTSFTGCISYDGAYKVAYFSFPLEAVSGLAGTTPRHQVILNVLNWFGFVSVQTPQGWNIPLNFTLKPNYPNPFNPSTNIDFVIPRESKVSLKVYNCLGKEVATLAEGVMSAGNHSIIFNAENLTSGLYFARLQADGNSLTQKLLLLK